MVKDIKTQVKILKEDTQDLSAKVRDLTFQYKTAHCFLLLNANFKILCLSVEHHGPINVLVGELNTMMRKYGKELAILDEKIKTKIGRVIEHDQLNFMKMYYDYKEEQINKTMPLDERLAQTAIKLSSHNLQLRLQSNLALSDFTLKADPALTDAGGA